VHAFVLPRARAHKETHTQSAAQQRKRSLFRFLLLRGPRVSSRSLVRAHRQETQTRDKHERGRDQKQPPQPDIIIMAAARSARGGGAAAGGTTTATKKDEGCCRVLSRGWSSSSSSLATTTALALMMTIALALAITTAHAQDINFGALASALASGAGTALRAGGGLPAASGTNLGQAANGLGGVLRGAGQLGQMYQMASGFFRGGGFGGGGGGGNLANAAASLATSPAADAAINSAANAAGLGGAARSWAGGAQALLDATLAPEGKACLIPTLSACWKDDGCRRGVQCMLDCAPSAGPAMALKWAAGGAQGADALALRQQRLQMIMEDEAAAAGGFQGSKAKAAAASAAKMAHATPQQQEYQQKLQARHARQQQRAAARTAAAGDAPATPTTPTTTKKTTITGNTPSWSDAPRCMGVCLYAAQGNPRFEAWNACARAAFKGPEELQASGLGQCGALPAAGVAKAAAAALKTGGSAAKGAARLFGGGGGGAGADAAGELLAEAAAEAAAAVAGAAGAGDASSAAAAPTGALGALSQAAAAGAAALSNPALLTLLRVPAISDAAELANPLCGAPRANLTALRTEPAAALLMGPAAEAAAVAAGGEVASSSTSTSTVKLQETLDKQPNLYAAELTVAEDDESVAVVGPPYGGPTASFAAVGVLPGAAAAKAAAPSVAPTKPVAAAPVAEAAAPAAAASLLQRADPKLAQVAPLGKKMVVPAATNNNNKKSSSKSNGNAAANAAATPAAAPLEQLPEESVMVADPRALKKGGTSAFRRLLMSSSSSSSQGREAAADSDSSWLGALAGALGRVTGGQEPQWEALPPSLSSDDGPTLISVDNSPLEELMDSEKQVKAPAFTPEIGGGGGDAAAAADNATAANPDDDDDDDDDDKDDEDNVRLTSAPSSGRGHWHIVKGLNPTFDCFPCQQYLFSRPATGVGSAESELAGSVGTDGDVATPPLAFSYQPGDPLEATYVIGWGDGERAAQRAAAGGKAKAGGAQAAGWRGADVRGRGAFVTRVVVSLRAASQRGAPKPVGGNGGGGGGEVDQEASPNAASSSGGRRGLLEEAQQEEEQHKPSQPSRRRQQQRQQPSRRSSSSPSAAREGSSAAPVLASPATMPSPGQWQAEYHVSGMRGNDRWFVVDAVGEDYALVLYCAEVGLPCQRGGFVLASPAAVRRGRAAVGGSASAAAAFVLPADVSARFDNAIRRSGWAEAYGPERVKMNSWCDVPVCPGVPLMAPSVV
jgi:hypothetical protein